MHLRILEREPALYYLSQIFIANHQVLNNVFIYDSFTTGGHFILNIFNFVETIELISNMTLLNHTIRSKFLPLELGILTEKESFV